jgi:hypothetical protein
MEINLPRPLKPYDVIRKAVKDGVSVARFKISGANGQKIEDLERTQRRDAALAALRRLLRQKNPSPCSSV